MRRGAAQRSTWVLLPVLIAALLGAGCEQSAPPLAEPPPPTERTPTRTAPPTTASFDANVLVCQVARIMGDATGAAAKNATDPKALARIYGDAAKKIRVVAGQAAGDPLERAITNVAVAVGGLARHFADGSRQPPDANDLTSAFEALPACETA